MSELDRIENFRLALMSQRETNIELRALAKNVTGLSQDVIGLENQVNTLVEGMQTLGKGMGTLAGGLVTVAEGLTTVADKGDKTAERLEDSIEVMKTFAEGQVEIRKTLADYGRRLDALEGKNPRRHHPWSPLAW